MKKSALLLSGVLVAAAALAVANEAMKPSPVQQLELAPQEIESDDSQHADLVAPEPEPQAETDTTADLFSAPASSAVDAGPSS
ncbi:hypothetical protein [Marinobacterium aestuariivivens]|uniref:Secreted protein n=1 Tax=Marinobacterium aestuariivivens TaxID=1698799 RepID=A0ABW1ZUR4_9GAMM